MPPVYRLPEGGPGTSVTNYLTVRGPATVFPGKEGIAIPKITDGTSRTIMVVEANPQSAVTWTKPDDYEYDASNPAAGLIVRVPAGSMRPSATGA